MGTLTKFSNPMPKKGTTEVETEVVETEATTAIEFNPRKLIDRKTASVLLLFVANVGIGIIMMLYRSCDNNNVHKPIGSALRNSAPRNVGELTHGQANLSLAPRSGADVIGILAKREIPRSGTREVTSKHNSRDKNEVIGTIYVHVVGKVMNPGVYQLSVGSKVYDALALAGGSLPTARLSDINLTRKLDDEEQIIVP